MIAYLVEDDIWLYKFLIYNSSTLNELGIVHTCIGAVLDNGSLPYKEYPTLLRLILKQIEEICYLERISSNV